MTSIKGRTLVQMTLHEGRDRIVRRCSTPSGHPVKRLTGRRWARSVEATSTPANSANSTPRN